MCVIAILAPVCLNAGRYFGMFLGRELSLESPKGRSQLFARHGFPGRGRFLQPRQSLAV
jgi:hypothetical protein